MHKVTLGIGGNLGQRELFLLYTRKHLANYVGALLAESSIYETAAWGMGDAPDFLNQVVICETAMSADEVLNEIRSIERLLGRKRSAKDGYQSRTCDIDILLFDDEVIDQADLLVPHPGIPKRRFVLEPLNELIPDFIHPVHGSSIASLLEACDDNTEVKKWPSHTVI
ncbi:2-amino-4-hydroxy-6-hydroxymethyldihydropteridine diphosphokinase [Sanyastnella coralliicola]|uniref:2-amino-4-hydroxy-6- hydroxymethyldihydropteridine diphosphokinase n=1 Tax=Sanyastnella coralliicola TaxID=3069118 RepID=UPI0027B8FDC6|nr:2-amino-4-hydroxy-6-hydroxymethyldihydropteridine diphosphokinase [Longitalea sp. SCSIO 12813]